VSTGRIYGPCLRPVNTDSVYRALTRNFAVHRNRAVRERRCLPARVGVVESYAVEAQTNDLAGQSVERVLTPTERRVVSRIQRREKRAALRDAVAEEVVRAAGAVATTSCRHLVLGCSQTTDGTVKGQIKLRYLGRRQV